MTSGRFQYHCRYFESSPFNASYAISNDMRDFENVRNNISVYNHAFIGPLFTWTNKHQEGFMARKLDCVLINDAWPSCFAHSMVGFLPLEMSDHSPALIKL